jgi:hypothetical protein
VLGWYLGTTFNEPPSTVVDSDARGQATAAQQQAASAQQQAAALRAEVAQLRGEVKAALDFQQKAKEAQDARDRAVAAERERRRNAREALSTLLDSGNEVSRDIRTTRVAPLEKVEKWIAQAEATLRMVLGEPHVRRSRDGAGINLSPRAWSVPPTPELSSALANLDIRLARIQEFLKELSD